MDSQNCDIASNLVSKTYIAQGSQALQRRRKLIKSLLSERRLPTEGWDDQMIELFLQEVSLMDSNNFVDNVGLGEREGRVAYHMVAKRHFYMSHGIGRSGELSAEQPKAAGSSLLAKVSNHLVKDACTLAGIGDIGKALIIPVATGMSLVLALLAVRVSRPTAKYVIWSRIDQKTCVKSISAAGYIPIVVPLKLENDYSLVTDMEAITLEIERLGKDSVACVITTTSCFAPRSPDDVVGVAKLCKAIHVPHIINNAYGVQSKSMCNLITSAWRKGRVDVVVQSTDKNFMVPVGGSFMLAHKDQIDLIETVNSLYPGRASIAPTMDVLMTLLHLGRSGWLGLLQDRVHAKEYLIEKLREASLQVSEHPIIVEGNDISFGMTLDSLGENATFLGSMLFQRCASGARVLVSEDKAKNIGGVIFARGFGQSYDDYPHRYMTVAAALGTTTTEIDEFFSRLKVCIAEFRKKHKS
jgi:O-phospho-L-seryl-tRNASec:L-selenocysteinyl-tRNA synthase